MDYAEWIKENYSEPSSRLGQCRQASERMQKVFPELTITNGEIEVLYDDNLRIHWWLKDAEGNIVDPTAGQFAAIIAYKEASADSDCRNYPRARCHNCGGAFYVTPEVRSMPLCTEKCAIEYGEYVTKGL